MLPIGWKLLWLFDGHLLESNKFPDIHNIPLL